MNNNPPPTERRGLKQETLSFAEVVAQSVANIAPSATPALIIPLVFVSAGNGTWLAYAIATVALLFVTAQINTFAARSASPGALYTFTTQGLGSTWGSISGWSLFLAYIFTACATLAGFTNYTIVFLNIVGHIEVGRTLAVVLMVADAIVCWWIAWQDVQLSTRAMLLLEFASVGLIVALAAMFFLRSGQVTDAPQYAIAGTSARGLRLALVLALFSFVGFESATALGEEARNPLRSIPRSVLSSVLIVGGFFTAIAYTMVLAFRGAGASLDKSASPLLDLARVAGAPSFGIILVVGAIVGQFACSLASINAAARVMYSMARHGFFHASAGDAHETHATPHVAIAVSTLAAAVVPVVMTVRGTMLMDTFGYLGSVATFGFLFSYVLVSIAAPVFLRRRNELRVQGMATAGIALLLLAIPIIGSVYPVPDPPYNYLPYVFLGLMALGAGRVLWLRKKEAPAG